MSGKKSRFINRLCSLCGHALSIEINKNNHYTDNIGYWGEIFGKGIYDEYWECAICLVESPEFGPLADHHQKYNEWMHDKDWDRSVLEDGIFDN